MGIQRPGLRVGKTDSTGTYAYVCDGTSPGSPILSDGHAIYTPGLSERRNGASLFYNSDNLGNLWTAEDGTGQAEAGAYLFTGFGASLYTGTGSAGASPLKYGGANDCQTDTDTGLVLMGHRYYDTRTGRFISQDPIGDGDNWYTYADNSPTNEVDPGGLAPMDGPGSSPVGSPGYADGAVSGLGGSMEEYGVVWHQYFVGGAPYYSYETPGVSHCFYQTYWAPDLFGDVNPSAGMGMIAGENRPGPKGTLYREDMGEAGGPDMHIYHDGKLHGPETNIDQHGNVRTGIHKKQELRELPKKLREPYRAKIRTFLEKAGVALDVIDDVVDGIVGDVPIVVIIPQNPFQQGHGPT